MTGVILLFLLGLVLMVKGGDSFVEGAEWMARVTGIPPFVVAATVVSLGTTMPELLVSTMAAAQGSGGMALGNAVGSVSCNTGLILGISLLFLPGRVDPRPLREKGTLLLLALLAMLAFGIDRRLTWGEGLFLLLLLVVFLKNDVEAARRSPFPLEEGAERSPHAAVVYIGKFLLGAVGLAAGARLLVDNGCILARLLGVPEAVVALTLVALGTSLPELVTTITALARGQSSLSVGNIIGANFLDLTLVPAVSSFAGGGVLPMDHPLDLLMELLLLTVSLLPSVRKGRFRRWQGLALLVLYGGYITLLF